MTRRPEAGVIPALDGLRGIAIILVMLHHFTYYRPTSGISAHIGDVLYFGWVGVDLFFVLSGFLITRSLLYRAKKPGTHMPAFLADRVLVMSDRPGRIVAQVTIDLPRPRDLSILATPQFSALAAQVRQHIVEFGPTAEPL